MNAFDWWLREWIRIDFRRLNQNMFQKLLLIQRLTIRVAGIKDLATLSIEEYLTLLWCVTIPNLAVLLVCYNYSRRKNRILIDIYKFSNKTGRESCLYEKIYANANKRRHYQ